MDNQDQHRSAKAAIAAGVLIGALAMLSSTPAQRARARARLARYNWLFAALTLFMLAFVFLPEFRVLLLGS